MLLRQFRSPRLCPPGARPLWGFGKKSDEPERPTYVPARQPKEPKAISEWHRQQGNHFQFMRSFYREDTNSPLIKFMQQPITVKAIRDYFTDKRTIKNIVMQSYIPERHDLLGNELAASHFIVHRGGAVKFHGEDRWIKADEDFRFYDLPNKYDPTKILQAIDCNGMELHYEGLVNFKGLKRLEWLSLYDCPNIDDWCMDRICYTFQKGLLYLDVRECVNVTERGIGAVYKMDDLKILRISHKFYNQRLEMTCLLLQELKPDLEIQVD